MNIVDTFLLRKIKKIQVWLNGHSFNVDTPLLHLSDMEFMINSTAAENNYEKTTVTKEEQEWLFLFRIANEIKEIINPEVYADDVIKSKPGNYEIEVGNIIWFVRDFGLSKRFGGKTTISNEQAYSIRDILKIICPKSMSCVNLRTENNQCE